MKIRRRRNTRWTHHGSCGILCECAFSELLSRARASKAPGPDMNKAAKAPITASVLAVASSLALAQTPKIELIPAESVVVPGESVEVLVRLSVFDVAGGTGLGGVDASILLAGEDGVGGIVEDAGETDSTWMFGRLPSLRLGGANGPGAGGYDVGLGTLDFSGSAFPGIGGGVPIVIDVFRFTVTRVDPGFVDLGFTSAIAGIFIGGGPANVTLPIDELVGTRIVFVAPAPGAMTAFGLGGLVLGSRRRRA